jgi:prepilin-type N-terminal cleavage/methylation domain-containing protein
MFARTDGERMRGGTRGNRGGFSLLELAIVVAIIAIIGAIVAPRVGAMAERSQAAQVAETVRMVQLKVEEEYQFEQAYPLTLQRAWFAGGDLQHSMFAGVSATVEVINNAALQHPVIKVGGSGVSVFWYNRGNGAFRARVPSQGTQAETLALYRLVNGGTKAQVSGIEGPGLGDSQFEQAPDVE